MGKTLDAAKHFADTRSTIIEPTETARAVFCDNPPSATALKVLMVLIDTAGPNMADDTTHTLKLSTLNAEKGLRYHTRSEIRDTMRALSRAVMHIDMPDLMQEEIASVIPYANIDYRDEANGDLTITWEFGKVFRRLAEHSNLYTKLDKAALLALRSRYAVALLRHCSTHFEKTKTTAQTFTVADLRQLLGVRPNTNRRFSQLKRKAIQPAITEINAISRWTLEPAYHKTGRTVTSITITWTEKPLAKKAATNAELDRHSAGRRERLDGTAEHVADHPPFPTSIHSFRGGFWETIYRAAGCRADMEATRTGFIEWTTRTGKPQTPQLFYNFCKGENDRKGIQ